MTQSPNPDPAPQGSLQLLIERAGADRDRALAALHLAGQRLQQTRVQGEQLTAYRDQYRQRWTTQFGRSGSMEILRCYQGFSERLDQAIAQQEAAQLQAEQHEARARQTLAAQELRLASLRKLVERREAEAQRAQQRREQRQSDDAAQRSAGVGGHWRSDGLSAVAW